MPARFYGARMNQAFLREVVQFMDEQLPDNDRRTNWYIAREIVAIFQRLQQTHYDDWRDQ